MICKARLGLEDALGALRAFKAVGPDARDENYQGVCKYQNRFMPSWNDTRFCCEHGPFSGKREESTQRLRVMQNILKVAFARQWSYDSAYQRVQLRTADIQDGKRPGSTFVILNDEFSMSSRQLGICHCRQGLGQSARKHSGQTSKRPKSRFRQGTSVEIDDQCTSGIESSQWREMVMRWPPLYGEPVLLRTQFFLCGIRIA